MGEPAWWIDELNGGQLLRCDVRLQLTSAEVARIRMLGIVRLDRERAQEGRWRRVSGVYHGLIYRRMPGGGFRETGKEVYRWQVRR
jgi:hypothetical protein